jgi:hypothetical protein
MAMPKTKQLQPPVKPPNKPFSFLQRLQEIGVFFENKSPQHKTMKRLVQRLDKAAIPYAIMGAMAVNAHGARRTTDDVDVLMTREGLEQFRRKFVGKTYDQVEGRDRRFVERRSKVGVDVLVTGLYPGRGKPGPFAFPDPKDASVKIEDINVVTLPHLVQLKLAARRYYDFGDVVFLIRVHNLDEKFMEQLHPSVHRDFLECLEEKRREDKYEARRG